MSIKFSAEMDVSAVERELAKLQRENERLRDKWATAGDAGERSFRGMQRAADAVGRSIGTVQDKLRQQIDTLQKAQAAGVKTAGGRDIGDQIEKLRRELRAMDADTRRATEHMAKLKGAVSTAMRDSITPTQALRAELRLYQEALRRGLGPETQLQAAIERTKTKLRESSPAYQEKIRQQRELKRWSEDVARQLATDAERQAAYVRRLQQAHKDGHLTAGQYQRALKMAHDQSGSLQKAGVAAVDRIKGSLLGLTSSTFGVAALIGNLQRTLEEAKQLDAQIQQRQLTVGQAQAAAIKNLGAVSTGEANTFLGRVAGIQTDVGFGDLKSLLLAASDTLSATGSNQELTLEIVRQAAPLFKDAPDQLAAFAGAAADLATIKGATSPEEIKGVISTVLSTQSQARITSLDAFKEAAAAIAGATVTDTSGDKDRAIREAGAAFAAIGGSIKDPEGALTKTAVANLATQLERLLPDADIVEAVSEDRRADLTARRATLEAKIEDLQTKEAETPAEQAKITAQIAQARQQITAVDRQLTGVVRAGTGTRTLAERIAAVQGDENLQRLFFGGDESQGVSAASFRGPITPVIRQLLTDSQSEAAQRFAAAQGTISDDPRTYQQLLANLAGGSQQLQLSEFAQRAEADRSAAELANVDAGYRATIRTEVEQALQGTKRGIGFIDTLNNLPMLGEMANFDINAAGEMGAAEAGQRVLLRRRQAIVEGGIGLVSSIDRDVNASEVQASVEAIAAGNDRDQVAALDASQRAAVERLDRLILLLEQQQQAVERQSTSAERTAAAVSEIAAETRQAAAGSRPASAGMIHRQGR